MSTIAIMLDELRAAGIVVRAEGGRLIVEGPIGRITSEMRADLQRRKPELLAVLDPENSVIRDPLTAAGLHEAVSLLAVAYQRYAKMPRPLLTQPGEPFVPELALSPRESVHGGGQQP